MLSHVISVLNKSYRRKNMDLQEKPYIGIKNPVFKYGAGVSTTISAQMQNFKWQAELIDNQSFNITTIDLPGFNDVRSYL